MAAKLLVSTASIVVRLSVFKAVGSWGERDGNSVSQNATELTVLSAIFLE